MTIKKYLHSCILIEDNGKRLVFDLGWFSFVEGKLQPEDFGPVDVVVLTHKHPDHYYPEALKKLYALKPFTVVTHREIADQMTTDGLSFLTEAVQADQSQNVAGFIIQTFTAPHGPLPIPIPHNLAYLINKTFLHTGDSYELPELPDIPILGLVVSAPWMKLNDALDFAKKVNPRIVVPIHDAIIKDFMLERIYQMCERDLKSAGIEFRPLGIGEKLAV